MPSETEIKLRTADIELRHPAKQSDDSTRTWTEQLRRVYSYFKSQETSVNTWRLQLTQPGTSTL